MSTKALASAIACVLRTQIISSPFSSEPSTKHPTAEHTTGKQTLQYFAELEACVLFSVIPFSLANAVFPQLAWSPSALCFKKKGKSFCTQPHSHWGTHQPQILLWHRLLILSLIFHSQLELCQFKFISFVARKTARILQLILQLPVSPHSSHFLHCHKNSVF